MKYVIGIVLVVIGILGTAVVFSSKDNSGNTTPVVEENKTLILSDIHGLEVDIEDSERLYLPNHQGLYVQEADKKITSVGDIDSDLMGFSISNTDVSVFFASGHPKSGGNLGVIRSNDAGQTWAKVSDGLSGPVDFHTMVVDKINDNLLYGAYQGTLQKTIDGGDTWSFLNDAPDQIIQLNSGVQEGEIYAATQNGLFYSSDGGTSWSNTGLSDEVIVAVKINPSDSKNIIVSSAKRGLLLSSDKGITWQPIQADNNISDTVVYIAIAPSNPDTTYAITRSLQIFKSVDGGLSWEIR